MIILDNTNKILRLTLASVPSTPVSYNVAYADHGATFIPGSSCGTVSNTTPTTITEAPNSDYVRMIRYIAVHNPNTLSIGVTLDIYDGSNAYLLFTYTLAGGKTLEFTADAGFNRSTLLSIGGVVGPESTTNGNIVIWDSSDGTVVRDSSISEVDLSDTITKAHDRSHAIDSTSDHTSTITAEYILKANNNGLPTQGSCTDTEVANAVASSHDRFHAIDSTDDHTSTITSGYILKANNNGLPAQGSNTDTEVADAVARTHDKSHAIDSTVDHTSSITAGYILKADSNGLPAQGSSTDSDVADAVSKKHTQQHSITSTSDHTSTATPNYLLRADSNGLPVSASALYYDSSNNRLGIDTTSPTEKLDVAGNIGVTSDNTYDVGSSSKWVKSLYATTVYCQNLNDSALRKWQTAQEAGLQTDIGRNWTAVGTYGTTTRICTICHLGSGVVLMTTGTSSVKRYLSTNWGATFTDLGTISGRTEAHMITNVGQNTVLIGSGGGGYGKIYYSSDCGANLTEVYSLAGNYWFQAGVNMGGGIILATGYGNMGIYRSTDGGLNWSRVLDPTGESNFVGGDTDGNGVAVFSGVGGQVWRTTDYGDTWTLISGTYTNAQAICYCGNGIWLMGTGISSQPRVYISKDNGVTWSYLSTLPSGIQIRSMTYLGGKTVLAGVYNTGKVYLSTDLGQTWTEVLSTGEATIPTIHYLGNGIVLVGSGVISGSGGYLWRSTVRVEPNGLYGWSYTKDGYVNLNGTKVGIGTTSPASELDVVGTVQCDTLRIDQTATSGSITPTHYFTINLNGTTVRVPCLPE